MTSDCRDNKESADLAGGPGSIRGPAGILGGMGPRATIDFMCAVMDYTPADKDQDHVRLIVDQNPKIPNRQAAILLGGECPGSEMAKMAVGLQAAGAGFLAIPCNSAQAFDKYVVRAVRIPVLSIVKIAALAAAELGQRVIGVLATDSCIRSGSYQHEIASLGARCVMPTDDQVQDLMRCITRIKAGTSNEEDCTMLAGVAQGLVDRGAEVVIAGCTEIPLIIGQNHVTVPLVQSTRELAKTTVAVSTGNIDANTLDRVFVARPKKENATSSYYGVDLE